MPNEFKIKHGAIIDGINSGSFDQYLVRDPDTGIIHYTTAGASGSSGSSGTSGQTGTSGTAGLSGSSGQSGTSGVSGTNGTSASAGSSGQAGTSGISGTNGTAGTSGLTGTSGSSGQSGTSGQAGTSGTTGTTGSSGSSGTAGTSGINGTNGTTGSSGSTGTSGTSGTKGSSGSSGTNGTAGTSGQGGTSGTSGTSIPGSPGFDGSSGSSGINGSSGTSSDGTSGTAGTSGTSGATGLNGTSGSSGQNGTNGTSGTAGTSGNTGTSGTTGTAGSSGSTGTSGSSGSSGQAGTSGTAGTAGSSGATGSSGVNGDKYATVSSTSNTIPTSHPTQLTFTVGTGLAWSFAQTVIIAKDSSNFIDASVVSYDAGTGVMVVNSVSNTGTGTYSNWELNLEGAPGKAGSSGSSGFTGTSGVSGTAGTSGQTGTSGSSGQNGLTGTSGTSGTRGSSGSSGQTGSSGTSGTSGATGISGSSGSSGSNGTHGTSGTRGSSGSSGINGTSGSSGANGSKGSSGSSGSSGSNGASGTSGSSGSSGSRGSSGSSGANGTSGSAGSSGQNGTSGTSGQNGTSGSSGTSGLSGTSGTGGLSGTSGSTGSSGSSGVNGTSGTSGLTGTSGSAGSSGFTGTSGSSGFTGTSGTSGTAGTNGSSGASGSSGSSGTVGSSGSSGFTGTAGTSGLTGTSGTNGTSGTSGANGTSGTAGSSGITGTSGSSGSTGLAGGDVAFFTFSNNTNTTTTLTDGLLRFNTTNLSAVTALSLSLNNRFSTSVSQWIDTFDDSNNSIKGFIRVFKDTDPNTFILLGINSDGVTISGNTKRFSAICYGSNGTFNNGDNIVVSFTQSGNRGDIFYSTLSNSNAIPTSHPSIVTLSIATGLAYIPGHSVIVAVDPSSTGGIPTYFNADVISYNNTTGQIVLSSTSNTGTGTYSSALWYINLDGGANGIAGSSGTSGSSGGTVTSIGLNFTGSSVAIPNAIKVLDSPVSGSGSIQLQWSGSAIQYVRGDGVLAPFVNYVELKNGLNINSTQAGSINLTNPGFYLTGSIYTETLVTSGSFNAFTSSLILTSTNSTGTLFFVDSSPTASWIRAFGLNNMTFKSDVYNFWSINSNGLNVPLSFSSASVSFYALRTSATAPTTGSNIKLVVTDNNGNLSFVSTSSIGGGSVTANNGVNISSNNIQLGGSLVGTTVINLNSKALNFNGNNTSFKINDAAGVSSIISRFGTDGDGYLVQDTGGSYDFIQIDPLNGVYGFGDGGFTNGAGIYLNSLTLNSSSLDLIGNNIKMWGIESATTSNILYYDTSTRKVTYGSASPTLKNTYVGFGNGSNQLTGSSDFQFVSGSSLSISASIINFNGAITGDTHMYMRTQNNNSSSYIDFVKGVANYAYVGVAGLAGNLLASSSEGDLVITANSRNINFGTSINGRTQLKIDTSGNLTVQGLNDNSSIVKYVTLNNGVLGIGLSTGSIQTYFVPLNKQYNLVSNNGSGQSILYTYTVPANTLLNDGDEIEIELIAKYASSGGTSANTVLSGFGVSANSNTGINNRASYHKMVVTRTSSTTATVVTEAAIFTDTTVVVTESEITGLDFTITNAVTAYGNGSASNQVTGKKFTVALTKAP
jgi:hypothetical protein